jgi:hypothetical protein
VEHEEIKGRNKGGKRRKEDYRKPIEEEIRNGLPPPSSGKTVYIETQLIKTYYTTHMGKRI